MSTFQDLINEILKVASGSRVEISEEWCVCHNLTSNGPTRRHWGQLIAKNPAQYGLYPDNTVNPGCGKFSNKSTNNLSHYIKQ